MRSSTLSTKANNLATGGVPNIFVTSAGLFMGHEVHNNSRGSSRIGSGREIVRTLTGRNASGQEVFKISRVGSGHPDPT